MLNYCILGKNDISHNSINNSDIEFKDPDIDHNGLKIFQTVS